MKDKSFRVIIRVMDILNPQIKKLSMKVILPIKRSIIRLAINPREKNAYK